MIQAEVFMRAAAARGVALYAGVPCSHLTPFINHTINSPGLRYVAAANEGDAVAIAAGAALAGVSSVAMFQNSGLGNAVNPLTSLTWSFRIPILLIVTWRGEPGGAADEPQHELMGAITPRLLELMDIPWLPFPTSDAEIEPALERATTWMADEQRPFAFVMRKGSVADTKLNAGLPAGPPQAPQACGCPPAAHSRRSMLAAIRSAGGGRDVLVATTGYTGRELFALGDDPNQLYMVGSMGCAVSLALGLALAIPERRVIAIDGDGALLMRLGALSTVGFQRPPNLVHVLLDNGQHESTGGQATVSPLVDFCAVARGCGYPEVRAVADPPELEGCLRNRADGLRFIHVPTLPGIPAALPRPTLGPVEVAARLRRFLRD
jgi:phosphonopyruvate decarboxylase